MYKGIDVSEWQGNIDFKKVKNSGIDFVMIRAGYGETYEDKFFKQNVYNAKANGLHVGSYYFVYATDVNSAKNNADNFIRLLGQFKGKIDYPVACDFEYDSVRFIEQQGIKVTKKLVCDITEAFCERVEKAGYYTMVYANQDYINQYYNNVIKKYDLWYANWNKEISLTPNMWQYSSKGKINGITGDVDLDKGYIDFADLIKKNKLNFIGDEEKQTLTFKVGDKFKIDEISGTRFYITLE